VNAPNTEPDTQRTDDLIRELSASSQPVERLPNPWIRLLYWIAGSVIYACGVAYFLNITPSSCSHATGTWFWSCTAVLAAMLISGGAMAMMLSIPGWLKRPGLGWLPVVFFVGWIVVLMTAWSLVPGCQAGSGKSCATETGLLGIPPGLLLAWMVRKGAPVNRVPSGMICGLVAGAFGALIAQFSCSNLDPLHMLVWHGIPAGAVTLAGAFGLRKVLSFS